MLRKDMIDHARQVLRDNDRGTYTVPTHGLYPFQWNWDSALSALGFAHYDEPRAWLEIETLISHQWDDGMIPHIIFHQPDDGYFPGPEVWDTGKSVPTTGITQPPVAGFAVARIFDRAQDKGLAAEKAKALLPAIHEWHKWFYRARDPEGTGLVAILHPWESGRDNSVDWDAALDRVSTDGVGDFVRRDTAHANPAHRPTDDQYKRYIWLVQHFRSLGWDNQVLHDASPFRVVDPGFNAILIRSCSDAANLASRLGLDQIAREARAMADRGVAALETLWNDKMGQYACFDRVTGAQIETPSSGGILPAFAPIPKPRIADLVRRIETLSERCNYLIPSHDPAAPGFDGLRYWRGPVWLIVNCMVADGLSRAGEHTIVSRIVSDCLRLIETSGFAEYHDPISAEPCGGPHFSWTAAMVIEILNTYEMAA